MLPIISQRDSYEEHHFFQDVLYVISLVIKFLNCVARNMFMRFVTVLFTCAGEHVSEAVEFMD
jgi:hypothetical protein